MLEQSDPLVIRTQVPGNDCCNALHIERACRLHLLQVRPVLGAVEERFEHRHVEAGEKRDPHPGEALWPDPAGYLDVVDRDDHVLLANVVLLPGFHGRGLGTRLLRRVLAHADARGVPVRLTVLRPNPARRLYERLGFVRTKEDEQRVWMERPCTLSREDP